MVRYTVSKLATSSMTLFAAFVMQVMFAPPLSILGVTPNFLMVAVIIISFIRGSREGITLGFFAGLLFDLVGTTIVGPMALALTITGFIAGLMKEQIFASSWILPVTVLGVASLIAETIYLIMLAVLGMPMSFFAAFFTRALPGALYCMLIAVIVFPALTRFLNLSGSSAESNTLKRVG